MFFDTQLKLRAQVCFRLLSCFSSRPAVLAAFAPSLDIVRTDFDRFPLTSRLRNDHILCPRVSKPCTMPGAVGFSNRAVSTAHGAACAVGAILARLSAAAHASPTATAINRASRDEKPPGFRAWAALSDDALPSALSSVAAAISHSVSMLHVAACGAVGRVGAAGPLPVRRAIDNVVAGTENAAGPGGDDSVTTVQAIFERLWTACKLGETSDASRRAEASAEALGKCCRGSGRAFVECKGVRAGEMEAVSARVRKTLLVLSEMAKNQVCGTLRRYCILCIVSYTAVKQDCERERPARCPLPLWC